MGRDEGLLQDSARKNVRTQRWTRPDGPSHGCIYVKVTDLTRARTLMDRRPDLV